MPTATQIAVGNIAEINPFRYRSYYYDEEIGLYYLQSRYYDANNGRFVNADEISMLFFNDSQIVGVNIFSYCVNNPTMNMDAWGYFYVSNYKLKKLMKAALWTFSFNPIGTTIIAIGVYKVYTWLVAKSAIIGAKLGALGGPAVAWILAGLFALVVGISGWVIIDALIQGKGIHVKLKYTWFGAPYGLDIGVS